MKEFYLRHEKEVHNICKTLLFGAVVYLFAVVLFRFVAPFAIAFLLAGFLEPFVRLLNKQCKIGRGLAGAIGILLVLGVLGVTGAHLGTRIAREASGFIENVPNYVEDVSVAIDNIRSQLYFLSPEINITLEDILFTLLQGLATAFTEAIRNYTLMFVVNSGMFVVGLFVCIVATYFIIKDKHIMYKRLEAVCPSDIHRLYKNMKRGLFKALGGYIKYSLIMMCISFAICTVGLLVIGYEYALLMGAVLGVLEFLPMVGTSSVLIPWAVLNLISGNFARTLGLVALFGINFVTRQLLEPKILSTQIGLYPLVTLASMFIGLRLFGFLGVVVGPVSVIVIKIVYQSYDIG